MAAALPLEPWVVRSEPPETLLPALFAVAPWLAAVEPVPVPCEALPGVVLVVVPEPVELVSDELGVPVVPVV